MNYQSIKVKDEHGNVFPSLKDCIVALGGQRMTGGAGVRLRKKGVITWHGHTITLADNARKESTSPATTDPLLAKLKERYSQEELEQIAKGEGISKRYIPFPEIHLNGKHHRMVVISDTHIGSVYSPEEWHRVVADFANDPANGIECILHCGDIVDGLKIGRAGTQIYELSEIGFDAQRTKAIQMMSLYHLPIYIISGNHDMYFKEFAGANIVESICAAVPNMTYIGHNQADIDVDGCKIRLFHGGDGNSYALSYRLQKIVEAITGGNKPNILLAGHVHKFCYIMDRNIHAVSIPSMQSQTGFMQGKRLAAHTGFLVLDFDTNEGSISNFGVKVYPFYA